MGPEDPKSQGKSADDANSDGRIVERLTRNGVFCGQTEDDSDKPDPEAGGSRNGPGQYAKVKGALHRLERLVANETDEDG